MKRIALSVLSALISLVLAQGAGMPLSAQSGTKVDDHLVVHEWGTFTSIAGEKGVSVEWRPLAGKSDLPTFVYTSGDATSGRGFRSGQPCNKCCLEALIRMETPVLRRMRETMVDRETRLQIDKLLKNVQGRGVRAQVLGIGVRCQSEPESDVHPDT